MLGQQSACRWDGDNLTIVVLVQPRASRDEWLGLHGEGFRVRITAPPVEGKANAHLVKFLAKNFGVPKSKVSLVSGDNSRHKSFVVESPQILPRDISPKDH